MDSVFDSSSERKKSLSSVVYQHVKVKEPTAQKVGAEERRVSFYHNELVSRLRSTTLAQPVFPMRKRLAFPTIQRGQQTNKTDK